MSKPTLARSRRQFLAALLFGTVAMVSTGLLACRMVSTRGINNNIRLQPSNTWVFAIGVLTYPVGDDAFAAGIRGWVQGTFSANY